MFLGLRSHTRETSCEQDGSKKLCGHCCMVEYTLKILPRIQRSKDMEDVPDVCTEMNRAERVTS